MLVKAAFCCAGLTPQENPLKAPTCNLRYDTLL